MKFNDFLAFLLTLIAIVIVVYGFTIRFSEGLVPRLEENCEGYSVFIFPDEDKIDTEMGKGKLTRLRVINAGSFGDKYEVSLTGPEWAVIKPDSFSLKSEESKSLFLYISPDLGTEGKYDLEVTVKSKCVSETEGIEIGVLKEEI